MKLGVIFKSDFRNGLVGYINWDWAGLKDAQKLTGGYTFLISDGLGFYQTKQSATIVPSSTKVEYIATTEAEKSLANCNFE